MSPSTGSIQSAFTIAGNNVVASLSAYLPNLIGAILLLLVGFILGNWIKILVRKGLEMLRLSELVKSTAVNKFFEHAEIKSKIEEVLGEVLRWIVILIFFIAAVNLLGLTTVSAVLTSILAYVPKVVAAALVLAAGVLVAGWAESLVKGAVSTFDLSAGRLLGKISSYVIVVFSALAAFSELGIAEQFVNTLFVGFVAMLAIGIGLAFGLGSKDVVSEVMKEWYKNLQRELKK